MGFTWEQYCEMRERTRQAGRSQARRAAREARERKRSKFRNIRTEYNGRMFDSKAEAKRAEELAPLVSVGLLEVEYQPLFILRREGFVRAKHSKRGNFIYRPDFLCRRTDSLEIWVEDVKGKLKQRDRDIAKLWRLFGPPGVPLRILYPDRTVEVLREE